MLFRYMDQWDGNQNLGRPQYSACDCSILKATDSHKGPAYTLLGQLRKQHTVLLHWCWFRALGITT